MTLKFRTKTEILKAISSAIFSVHEEATFIATPEKIQCKVMDASHWMMINFSWPKEAFEDYECNENFEFGFRSDDLKNILKRFAKDDQVIVEVKREETAPFSIMNGTGTKKYEMRVIAAAFLDNIPEALKADFTVTAELSMQDLNEILQDVAVVGDMFDLFTEEKRLMATASGDSAKFKRIVKVPVDGEGSGSWNLTLMKNIVADLSDSSTKVLLSFGVRTPLKLQISITDKLDIFYYLAPKMKE